MMKKYLSISQFARLSRASAKSLRYYDEIGLFQPAYTDPETGYRYYNINQIYDLNLVRFCIEEGISTEEIKAQRKTDNMLDASRFFKECWETSLERLREAYATTLRMEAYSVSYSEQMTDDMIKPRQPAVLENLTLATTPLGCKDLPDDYSLYLKKLTYCLQETARLKLIALAHQGVLCSEDGTWHAFINVACDGIELMPDASQTELSIVRLAGTKYRTTSIMSADVERCFRDAFLLDKKRKPKLVLEAWAYATFLNIPAFKAYYED